MSLFSIYGINVYGCVYMFGCARSLLLRGLLSSYGALVPDCIGFSCCGVHALGHTTSVVAVPRLNSYGAQAYFLCSMWDLPGSGIKAVSPALQTDSLPLSHQGSPCFPFIFFRMIGLGEFLNVVHFEAWPTYQPVWLWADYLSWLICKRLGCNRLTL